MHFRLPITVFAMLFLLGCSSNSAIGYYGKYKTDYSDFFSEGETAISSKYQYVVSKKVDGGFVYREFFPETRTLTLEAHFLDRELKERDGPYNVWFDNGLLKESGQYENNRLTGDCKLFSYDGGMLHIKSSYVQGIPNGTWEYYYSDGKLRTKETYVNGVKEGAFIEYDSFGMVRNEGVYNADTIVSQITSEILDPNKILDQEPAFCSAHGKDLCGTESSITPEKAWNNFVNARLRYPHLALDRKVQGRALVRFLVDLDGSIMDIEVLHGLCESITKEVERLVRLSSPWHPGMRDGEPIPVTYYLPITFKIDDTTH